LLERVSAALCDAVTGSHESQARLLALERANLFLVPLNEQRSWYRFHPLFAGALRTLLRRRLPWRVSEVYVRASAWCEANGQLVEAVEYALAGDDLRRAAQLLDASAHVVLESGYIEWLSEKIEQLPDGLVRVRPRLCVAHAYALILSGARVAARRRVLEAEEAFVSAASRLDPAERTRLQAELAAVRVNVRFVSGADPPRAMIDLCRQTLAALPDDHPFRGFVTMYLGTSELIDGDAQAASQTLSTLMRESEARGDALTMCMSLLYLGLAQLLQGHLDQLRQHCLHVARKVRGYVDGEARASIPFIWGKVLYERNHIAAAPRHLNRGLALRFGPTSVLFEGYSTLAYMQLAQGDQAAARQTVERALAELEGLENRNALLWFWSGRLVRAHQARLWLLQGDADSASRWACELERTAADQREKGLVPPTYVREWEEIVLARLRLAEGQADEALALLSQLGEAAEAGGRNGRLLEILVLQAAAHVSLGDTRLAQRVVQRALALAAPERFVRPFIEGGPAIQRLLALQLAEHTRRKAPDTTPSVSDFRETLLVAFGPSSGPWNVTLVARRAAISRGSARRAPGRAGRLTPREQEVIRLIAEGASNEDIARELWIEKTTAKRHVSNILSALEARNRTEAVARARARGYLDPDE
jgi:LuxR family maltose regulon positive regulatory protein